MRLTRKGGNPREKSTEKKTMSDEGRASGRRQGSGQKKESSPLRSHEEKGRKRVIKSERGFVGSQTD